jgi:ribonuclease VapC
VIAADTSALMAVVRGEPQADACISVLEAGSVLISAGTVAEALIVSGRANVGREMLNLIDRFDFEIVPVTDATARRIGRIYARWGRGAETAGLNFGDCFAYDVAKENNCPLLYVGRDFAKTDVKSVLR